MSEDLKYLHFNNDEANRKTSKKQARANQSRTFAIKALTEKQIKESLSVFIANTNYRTNIRLTIGLAKTSLDDNYNRSIGRDLSSSKMKHVDLDIESATVNNGYIFITFVEYEGVKLTARLNRLTGFSTFFGKMNGTANKAK